MSPNEVLALLMFVGFIVSVFTGYPVAWLLGGLSVLFTALAIILEVDFHVPVGVGWNYTSLTIDRIWNVMENWVMVALPMFILMGLLLDRSGIAKRLMTSIARLLGPVRGGLAITVTVIGLLLAATTGIIGASVVLLALLGLPVMLEHGYDKSLAAGTVCAVGTLGILIPPSIMLVLMADRMAMSVGDLFLGAVFPGALLGGLYITYLIGYGMLRPEGAPSFKGEAIDWLAIWELFLAIVPAAFLILAVLGSIFFGLATPTEAAGVGAAGALLLALLNKALTWGVLREVIYETTRTTAFIFAVLLGATAYSLVLRGLGGDQLIERALLGLPFEPSGVIICILFATFLLGFFLDWIELTLIILPLVSPIVVNLGFDPVWFTILFAVCLQTSFLTPPVGFAIFYLKGVAPEGIGVTAIYRGVVPFILLQLLGLTIIFNWTELVTWLPAQAYSQ
ncbi:MAG TPA: TRAP transporter large permease subunit [Pseudomonadales bacterium]|nr:C4-dicarboxylate ABC transporter [Gammaproteobacteria bacterium]MDP6027524.1 TRAP transporter large permease subunit [Pseudomonadales bacterium]MDP7316262.1 TRAP transporter large permease subunit [Pseudomonadales bacterium]HJP52034.1 TRAP transporter large permease subunit [Pseudomonadales bacterium]